MESGEGGTGSAERGTANGEGGTGSGERGTANGEGGICRGEWQSKSIKWGNIYGISTRMAAKQSWFNKNFEYFSIV